jgi:hypothetical protein
MIPSGIEVDRTSLDAYAIQPATTCVFAVYYDLQNFSCLNLAYYWAATTVIHLYSRSKFCSYVFLLAPQLHCPTISAPVLLKLKCLQLTIRAVRSWCLVLMVSSQLGSRTNSLKRGIRCVRRCAMKPRASICWKGTSRTATSSSFLSLAI